MLLDERGILQKTEGNQSSSSVPHCTPVYSAQAVNKTTTTTTRKRNVVQINKTNKRMSSQNLEKNHYK